MLKFDPATGLYTESTEAIRETVRADWRAAFGPQLDVDAATPAGQLIDSETAIIAQKDAEVLYMSNQFNPLISEGVWQDALGQLYFLTRKVAEPTVVDCLCTGLPGTVIPAGAMVKSSLDGLILRSTKTATIPEASRINIAFAAQSPGPIPVAAGTITQIVATTPGWDTVSNPAAGVMGRHAEGRAAFEARRYRSVAKNGHGTVDALYGEIADLTGVLDLVLLENTGNNPITTWGVSIPGHSIFASIYGGVEADIAGAIYRKKDAGCGTAGNTELVYRAPVSGGPIYTYYIERPEPLPFGVQVNIRLTPGTPADIVDRVKAAILANFSGADGTIRVLMASIVYASRLYAPAINAGVQDLVSVKIAAPFGTAWPSATWADEITIMADRVPVLSADNIYLEVISA